MQQGFDYCYDKRLYDRLLGGNAEQVRQHLLADTAIRTPWSGSWRITTNPGPRRRSAPGVRRRPRWRR